MKTTTLFLATLLSFSSIANNLEVCRGESGLFGFCNATGSVVIPQVYYDAYDFVNGHAAVLVDDKWAIINTDGKQVVSPRFDEVIECINTGNTLLVRVEDKWQLIDSKGNELTDSYEIGEPRFEFQLNGAVSEITKNSWIAAIKRNKWGVIDMDNNVKMDFDYDWLSIIRKEVDGIETNVGLVLKKKEKYAWLRADGKAGSGFYFDHYLGQNDNHIFFEKGGDLIVLDGTTGQKEHLTGKQFFVLRNDQNQHGLVSAERNKIVVPFKYDIIRTDLIGNHVVFGHSEKFGLADLWGNVILQPEYKEIKALDTNPLVLAVRNSTSKVAIVAVDANKANHVTEFKYTFAKKDEQGIYVGVGNKHGYVTINGTETWRN